MKLACLNDATLSGKVVGILITMNEKKFDFFLAARSITNVVESIAKLEKERLPGRTVIPANLPSPLPSFNKRNPLTYNNSTLLYEQLSNEPILH